MLARGGSIPPKNITNNLHTRTQTRMHSRCWMRGTPVGAPTTEVGVPHVGVHRESLEHKNSVNMCAVGGSRAWRDARRMLETLGGPELCGNH